MTKHIIDELVRSTPGLWRGKQPASLADDVIDSGFPTLNTLLSTGGWPCNTIIELVVNTWGNGELQLVLPLMRHISQQKQYLAFIAPPHYPYAPALSEAGIALDYLLVIDAKIDAKEIWWSAEKLLRQGQCTLVCLWPQKIHPDYIRRLQHAAAAGNSLGIIFHRNQHIDSPVTLRLKVAYGSSELLVTLLKSRYGRQQQTISLPLA